MELKCGWGCENCDIVNKVKLRFCKFILHVHKSTCSNMVYLELGETPLHIDIKCKMILYWARLITSKENKLSKMIYSLIYKLYEKDLFHSTWISSMKNILDSAGFSGIWTNQSLPKSPDHFNTTLKLIARPIHTKLEWRHNKSWWMYCILYN